MGAAREYRRAALAIGQINRVGAGEGVHSKRKPDDRCLFKQRESLRVIEVLDGA